MTGKLASFSTFVIFICLGAIIAMQVIEAKLFSLF